mmetsp:Transcript_1436/g.2609  ORF Transcript_1436/g.2609 Transcript_1436/m.2609 type:complete len:96 (-) Transcript_1436:955-1242(-)
MQEIYSIEPYKIAPSTVALKGSPGVQKWLEEQKSVQFFLLRPSAGTPYSIFLSRADQSVGIFGTLKSSFAPSQKVFTEIAREILLECGFPKEELR